RLGRIRGSRGVAELRGDRVERGFHLRRGLETLRRRLGHRSIDELLPVTPRRAQPRHRLLDMRERYGQRVRTVEWQVAAEHLVRDDTEAVEVCAPVDRVAAGLFGTHVTRR